MMLNSIGCNLDYCEIMEWSVRVWLARLYMRDVTVV